MKPYILSLAFAVTSIFCVGQNFPLSEHAQISIITCGPYQGELYSAFGHSAIRVYDPTYRFDKVYNYGVFDFDQPNFYLNFARGYSLYKLGTAPYPWFRDIYISYNRYIHEQVLNLTISQQQKVFDFLEWNAQPENCNYLYDYFYDNCATRVRDVFVHVLKDDVVFDTTFIKTDYSIRDLTDLYLEKQPWGDLGIDICLGLPMDKKASPYEYMFLPDYIEYSFDNATIRIDSSLAPLVKNKAMVYESVPQEFAAALVHPLTVFGSLLVLITAITVLDWKRKKISRWVDVLLWSVLGAIGVVLLLLWVATNHKAAAQNFNLLWALPTHMLVLFFYVKKSPWVSSYFKIVAAVSGVLLLTWFLLPQQIHVFLIPFVLAIFFRSAALGWLLPWQKSGSDR